MRHIGDAISLTFPSKIGAPSISNGVWMEIGDQKITIVLQDTREFLYGLQEPGNMTEHERTDQKIKCTRCEGKSLIEGSKLKIYRKPFTKRGLLSYSEHLR